MTDPSAPSSGLRRPLPRWKKALVAVSLAAAAVGGGLHAYGYARRAQGDAPRQTSSNPRKAVEGPGLAEPGLGPAPLVDGGSRPRDVGFEEREEPGETAATESLAPLLTKGGLSFFLGFCMGFAVRTFLKVSALFIGVAAILFFTLQYFGVIEGIQWSNLDEKFQSLASAIGRQLQDFKTFVEGHLPSSAAATAGAFTGWKRN